MYSVKWQVFVGRLELTDYGGKEPISAQTQFGL